MKFNSSLLALCCLLLGGLKSYCQKEKVYLDLDKYTCRAGDTVWFRGYVMQASRFSSLSTNLYVEIYTEKGSLVSRYLFPIFHGHSLGQFIFPDSIPTDNYYVVAFTKQQLSYDSTDLFSVPILVYNKEKPNSNVFHKRRVAVSTSTGRIVDGVRWLTSFYQGKLAVRLSIDSGAAPIKLRLSKPGHGDTSLVADLELNDRARQEYVLYPIDSSKRFDTIYLFKDSTLIGRQNVKLKTTPRNISIHTDTLDISPYGYNSWEIQMPDSGIYYSSVAVVDADRSVPCPFTIDHLTDSYTDNLTLPVKQVDSSYITYAGYATRESGKKIKDELSKDIVVVGVKDTAFVFTKVIHVDPAGHFKLDSLYFFDNMDLQFQINKEDDSRTKDIKLNLVKYIPPSVDSSSFSGNWEDDTKPLSQEDTLYTKEELKISEFSKVKTLKTAVVKGRKSMREELDHKYTTGIFSEPALFSFDLRSETRYYSLEDFLRVNIPGIEFDIVTGRPKYHDTSVWFYLNEQLTTWDFLKSGSLFKSLAYAKAFVNEQWQGSTPAEEWLVAADDNMYKSAPPPLGGKQPPSSPGKPPPLKNINPQDPLIVCLYTRKDAADFRMLAGGLNSMAIKGYSKILPFTSDKVTLSWNTWEVGSHFRITFHNNETTKRFRIKVEGITSTGEPIHYEAIVE